MLNSMDIDTFELGYKLTFTGPDETAYSNQIFHMHILIPEKYPKSPLECFLTENIYHLNVNQNKGPT